MVVLPAPFGPSKATISCGFTVTLTSLRITLFLIIFVKWLISRVDGSLL